MKQPTLSELKLRDEIDASEGIAFSDVRRVFLRTNEAWMRETLKAEGESE